MGKNLDRIVLWGLVAAACFALALAVFGNIPFAMALAFAATLALHALYRLLHARFSRAGERNKHRYAAHLIQELRLARDAEAELSTLRLLCQGLGMAEPRLEDGRILCGTDSDIARVLTVKRHAQGKAFDANDLLACFHALPSTPGVLLCVPGPLDGQVRSVAKALERPAIRLLDEEQMREAIAKAVGHVPEMPRAPRRSFGEFFALLTKNVRPLRSLLYGALLLALYWLYGGPFYLCASLLMLAMAALSARRRFAGAARGQ